MNEKMDKQEVEAWAALVAQHWKHTGRNPTDTECDMMVATAREMAADGYSLLH
jgi:hypothetical protein